MAEIPQEIIRQFFEEQGVKNLILNDYGYTSTIAPTGDFKYYNGKELSVYRLTVLLSISEGTYINDPNFGVKIDLFQKSTKVFIENLKNEIAKKINHYEKDLMLIRITDKWNETNKSLSLKLDLKYKPTNEDMVLSFGFIRDMKALTRLL